MAGSGSQSQPAKEELVHEGVLQRTWKQPGNWQKGRPKHVGRSRSFNIKQVQLQVEHPYGCMMCPTIWRILVQPNGGGEGNHIQGSQKQCNGTKNMPSGKLTVAMEKKYIYNHFQQEIHLQRVHFSIDMLIYQNVIKGPYETPVLLRCLRPHTCSVNHILRGSFINWLNSIAGSISASGGL